MAAVGEGSGIRTHGRFCPAPGFKSGAFDLSAIPPYGSRSWSRTNLPRVRTWCSTDELYSYVEAAEGIEPPSPGSKPDAQTAVLCRYVVGQVGFEPTVFLMSRFYRPLPSPFGY